MEGDKDRFGETMRLVERAKEDIYFAERDRELLEKLRAQLRRVEKVEADTHCPKCPGKLESYTFQGIALDRCHECGGMWLDKGELDRWVRGSIRLRRKHNSTPRLVSQLMPNSRRLPIFYRCVSDS
jgi:Zn-finger nucleic acid-binding protein